MDETKNEGLQSTNTTQETSATPSPTPPVISASIPGPFELFERAWKLYTERFWKLIAIAVVPAVLAVSIGLFFPEEAPPLQALIISLMSILVGFIQLLATIALLYMIVSEQPLSIQEAYKKGITNFLSYLWVAILVGVATFIGFLLLIIPGIIFSIWFTFSFYVLIVENKRGVEALKASREYVRGYWWPIFGRILFFVLIAIAATIALGFITLISLFIPHAGPIVSEVGGAILSLLLTPFSIAYMYSLYRGVKSLKATTEETPGVTPTPASA